MSLVVLQERRDCVNCLLGDPSTNPGVTNRGIATRSWDGGTRGLKKALVIVGKAPAVAEDAKGLSFVGDNGILTNRSYIAGMRLHEHADVYLANAVRCKLPLPSQALPQSAMKACRQWLVDDLIELDRVYEEVVLLCTGSEAVKAVFGRDIGQNSFRQGTPIELGGKDRRVFVTLMAINLAFYNDPAKATAVYEQLSLLEKYLVTGELRMLLTVLPEDVSRTNRIPWRCPIVSIDFETYGKFRWYRPPSTMIGVDPVERQHFFHPRKMAYWDKIAPEDIFWTCGAAWYDPETGELRNRFYNLRSARERDEWLDDMIGLWSSECTIVGSNVTGFDIQALRAFENPILRAIFDPYGQDTPRVIDIGTLNFLDCDQRRVRGLKPTMQLLQVLEYREETPDAGDEIKRYDSPEDVDLQVYQVMDVYGPLEAMRIFLARMKEKYPDTAKGSKRCLDWYSDEHYLAMAMCEVGTPMRVDQLTEARRRIESRLIRVVRAARRMWSFTPIGEESDGEIPVNLVGKGSGKFAEWIALQALECLNLRGDPRVSVTDKGMVSCDENNRHLFLEECEGRTLLRRMLQALERAHQLRDSLSRYYHPLTGQFVKMEYVPEDPKPPRMILCKVCKGKGQVGQGRGKARTYSPCDVCGQTGRVEQVRRVKDEVDSDDIDWGKRDPRNNGLIDGVAYPTVFVTPSVSEGSSDTGGTQQIRWAIKGPALQVFPKAVERTECSRFPGGAILKIDMAQAEWRTPAMWSWDESLLRIFREGLNIHEFAASAMVGHPVDKRKEPQMYALGKTGGLAVQFLGTWRTLQRSARKMIGLELTEMACRGMIAALHAKYARLIAWQREQIKKVERMGYLECPPFGVTRTFFKGKLGRSYATNIVNFPAQALAAELVIDAQITADKWLRANGLRTVFFKNRHDEGKYDVPPEELAIVAGAPDAKGVWRGGALEPMYKRPPVYDILVGEYGMCPVPLDCECKVIYNGHIDQENLARTSRGGVR